MKEVEIPGFGKAMLLFVDDEKRLMYFATPEERRRVDAQLIRDESQSARTAADFENVVALTPNQVKEFLSRQPETQQSSAPESASSRQNHEQHLRGRYAA
jgi:hypothetical protein